MVAETQKPSVGTMEIGRGVIRCGGTTYPLASIASYSVVEMENTETNPVSEKAMYVASFAGFMLVISMGDIFRSGLGSGALAILALLGCGFVVVRRWTWTKPGPMYGIEIINSARSTRLVVSPNYGFIKRIENAITDAIHQGSKASVVTVNLANEMVVDQSTRLTYVFHVNPQPGAFTSEQLAVIRQTVEPALTELGRKLEAIGATDQVDKLKELVAELSAAQPSKSKITRIWERLKNTNDAYEIGEKLLSAGVAIAKLTGLM